MKSFADAVRLRTISLLFLYGQDLRLTDTIYIHGILDYRNTLSRGRSEFSKAGHLPIQKTATLYR